MSNVKGIEPILEDLKKDDAAHVVTVPIRDLKKVYLITGGYVTVKGKIRELGYKRLCPGVFSLFLKPAKTEAKKK
jgi:hypothetical protein